MLSVMTLAASCVDEIEGVDVSAVKSKDIIFGGGMTDDIIVTRSGDNGHVKTTECKVTSESGDVSLPVIVEVEKGIKGTYSSAPATRALITRDVNAITQLDAWAIYTKYTDEEHTDFEDRYLYFDENKVDGAALPFSKNETDGIFYSDRKIYPWPGDATAMFNFVTVSPVNSGFKASINALNNIVSFDYTVPADPAQHKDILVASPEMIETDYRQPVPLTFKHVMAAVNVKVGEVPNGNITSVKFTGVYNKASYFPDGDGWVNRTIADGGEFSVDLPDGGVTVGTQSNGTILTTGEAGFMMIPQQLYTGAELQVTFLPDGKTEPILLRASIQGDTWEMNTTTNYWISINPDYMISIVPLDKTLDSHYIITKVEISSEFPIWRLTASANDNADVTVVLEQNLNPMAKLGFWTDKVSTTKDSNGNYILSSDSARGSNITAGTATQSQIVAVFIPENITGNTREVTLTLQGGTSFNNMESTKELVLTQNSVKWLQDPMGTGDMDTYWGCEILIENGIVPWGFCFDDLNEDWRAYGKETNQPPGWIDKIVAAMTAAGLNVSDLYAEDSPIRIIQRDDHKSTFLIRIDYGKLGQIDIAESALLGLQNTSELYNFEGINVIASIKDFLIQSAQAGNKGVEHVPGTFNGNIDQTLDFAAMYAMKRNRFHLYTEVIDGDGGAATMTIPFIESKDLNWYLPAKDQFQYFMNRNWGQAFSFNDLFWTSTAAHISENDNVHAYAFLNGMETVAHRNDNYLTFALRQYTISTDVNIPLNPDDVIKPGEDNGPEYGEGGGDDGNTGGNIGGGTN